MQFVPIAENGLPGADRWLRRDFTSRSLITSCCLAIIQEHVDGRDKCQRCSRRVRLCANGRSHRQDAGRVEQVTSEVRPEARTPTLAALLAPTDLLVDGPFLADPSTTGGPGSGRATKGSTR